MNFLHFRIRKFKKKATKSSKFKDSAQANCEVKALFTSLMFERGRGWSGLLVEPHPLIFAKVALLGLPPKRGCCVRKCAGAACAKESLECGNLPGHWRKVYFHQGHLIISNLLKFIRQFSEKAIW